MVSKVRCPISISNSLQQSYWRETSDWITIPCLIKSCQTRKLHWSWSAGFRGSLIRARYWSYLRNLKCLSGPQWFISRRQIQVQGLDQVRPHQRTSKETPQVVEFSTQVRKTCPTTADLHSRETFSNHSLKHQTRSYNRNSLPVMWIQGSRSALCYLTWCQISHSITTNLPRHQWTQPKSDNTTMISPNGSNNSKEQKTKNKLNRLRNWPWSMWVRLIWSAPTTWTD